MTEFTDQYADDLAEVVENGELSMQVTYTPRDGSVASTIWASVRPYDEDSEYDLGDTIIKKRAITILTDAAKGITNPKKDDVVTIDGAEWKVLRISGMGLGKARLEIYSDIPKSRHGEGHIKRPAE